MKNLLFFTLIVLCGVLSTHGQAGKYAGSQKEMIGKIYTRDMPGIEDWEALGGSVMSNLDEPEIFLVDIFKKGTTRLIMFTVQEDTAVQEYKIVDVVEVKGVLTTQEIKTGICREDKNDNSFIVALVQPRNIQYNKAIKAWRLNRDKRRVEVVTTAKVDCLQEAFDE